MFLSKFFKKIIAFGLFITILFVSLPAPVNAAVPTIETNPAVIVATPSGIYANLAEKIQEFIFGLTMENVKKKLLDITVSQIISGIAGGEPQFVRDYAEYYSLEESKGVLNAIQDLKKQGIIDDGPEGALIESMLTGRPINSLDYNVYDSNPITQNKPFSWDNFVESWQPQNNFYGRSVIARDYVTQKASEAREAARDEVIAGSGFPSVKDDAGQITTPGKTVSDLLSRAAASDIDYIVNLDGKDPASFVNSLASSLFNQMLNRLGDGGGLMAIANNVLSGDGLGSLAANPEAALNDFLNSSLENLYEDAFNSLSGSAGSFKNALNEIESNQAIQDSISAGAGQFSRNLGNIDTGSIVDSAGLIGGSLASSLNSYKQNKISSYQEIQKTIWYLEDIKTFINNRPTACPSQSNFYRYVPDLTSSKSSNYITLIDNVLDNLNSKLTSLGDEITSADSIELTSTDLLRAETETAVIKDLYTADITVSHNRSENFDIFNNLPLNLTPEDGYRFVRGANTITICPNSNSDKIKSADIQLSSQNVNFFNNTIKFLYTYKGSDYTDHSQSSGEGNYLGLTISTPSPNGEPFFYFHTDNMQKYLDALTAKINRFKNAPTLLPDNDSLSNYSSYRRNQESTISSLYETKLYLADIKTANLLLETANSIQIAVHNNMEAELSRLNKIIITQSELEQSNKKVSEFNNLFTAGLTSSSGSNFDLLNKLPFNLTETNGSVMPKERYHLTSSVAPFSSNLNYLGRSVLTVFYYHNTNVGPYLTALLNKIDSLRSSGLWLK